MADLQTALRVQASFTVSVSVQGEPKAPGYFGSEQMIPIKPWAEIQLMSRCKHQYMDVC